MQFVHTSIDTSLLLSAFLYNFFFIVIFVLLSRCRHILWSFVYCLFFFHAKFHIKTCNSSLEASTCTQETCKGSVMAHKWFSECNLWNGALDPLAEMGFVCIISWCLPEKNKRLNSCSTAAIFLLTSCSVHLHDYEGQTVSPGLLTTVKSCIKAALFPTQVAQKPQLENGGRRSPM